MNSEEDEFRRIEAEAKRRAIAKEYDDTQTYTSESVEQYLYRCGYEAGAAAKREAIKKALAQSEQQAEPVCPSCKGAVLYECVFCSSNNYPPAAQRTWVGLTDEEIKSLYSWWPSYDQMPALMVLAKDIQENLKERNNG